MLSNCVKSICIRNFSGPYFPAFGLNTERYLSVFIPNAGNYGRKKLRIRTLFMQFTLRKDHYLEALFNKY